MTERFAPKAEVKLEPPQRTPISIERLKQCDGSNPEEPTYVCIKGVVFDVTGNPAYSSPDGNYCIFAGKDASKALAKSSLKPENCVPDTSGLTESEREVLDNWFTFFSKRYNQVGIVREYYESGSARDAEAAAARRRSLVGKALLVLFLVFIGFYFRKSSSFSPTRMTELAEDV